MAMAQRCSPVQSRIPTPKLSLPRQHATTQEVAETSDLGYLATSTKDRPQSLQARPRDPPSEPWPPRCSRQMQPVPTEKAQITCTKCLRMGLVIQVGASNRRKAKFIDSICEEVCGSACQSIAAASRSCCTTLFVVVPFALLTRLTEEIGTPIPLAAERLLRTEVVGLALSMRRSILGTSEPTAIELHGHCDRLGLLAALVYSLKSIHRFNEGKDGAFDTLAVRKRTAREGRFSASSAFSRASEACRALETSFLLRRRHGRRCIPLLEKKI